MKSVILSLSLLALAGCNSHHGHEAGPAWQMEVIEGEEGIPKIMPVLIDDYTVGLPYSPVNIQAEAPVAEGGKIKRAFSLYSTGEQRVRTEVNCDVSKHEAKGEAGAASLALLGVKVKFYCLI